MAASLYGTNGTNGKFATRIAWIDWGSSFSLAPSGSQNLNMTLTEGEYVTFTVSNTITAGAGITYPSSTAPTWPDAAFGTTGYLVSSTAYPCIYGPTTSSSPNSRLNIGSITVKTSSSGSTISNYLMVVGDCEVMNGGKSLTFTTNGGNFQQLLILPQGSSSFPDAGTPNISGVGTQSVTITPGATVQNNAWFGTTTNCTTVTGTFIGHVGMVFGFVVTKIIFRQNLVKRINASDQFTLGISGTPNSSITTTGATVGIQSNTQTPLYIIPSNSYTLSLAMAAGSSSALSGYTTTVSSTNANTTDGTSVANLNTITSSVTATIGDFITATVLNDVNVPITINKTVDKTTVNAGEILTYTVSLRNISSFANANSLILSDTTPTGTTFLSDTLYIDGVLDSDTNIGPSSSISFGSIYPNDIHTVTYKVSVTSIPTPNTITNAASVNFTFAVPQTSSTLNSIVSTTVNYLRNPVLNSAMFTGNFTINPSNPNSESFYLDSTYVVTDINTATITTSKTCSKEFTIIGDVLTYTVPFKNVGNALATNVLLTDTLPSYLTIKNFYLDGVATTINLASPGYNFGTILAGEAHTITYNAIVNTTPSPSNIANSASIRWNYTVDPSVANGKSLSNNTNIVTTTINYPYLNSTKYVNARYAAFNDVLTYTIVVSNTGTTVANGVTLTETLPQGLSYVSGTLTVNGSASANPLTAIQLGNLNINGVATISFKAKVL